MSSRNFCSNLFIYAVKKKGYMNAKSMFQIKLSSHIFWLTNKATRTMGLQLVGQRGNSVKLTSLFMYTRQIMQHSGENCAVSNSALTKSIISSTVGVQPKSYILSQSKSSGFSLMYFSSEKRQSSLEVLIVFPCAQSYVLFI